MLCGAMQFAAHMIALASSNDTLWLTRLGAPRFYPDAVTLSGVESAPAQIETIAALVGSTREREWAVKDSFQSLELNSLGFEPLFDAEWIAMSPPPPDLKGHPAAKYRSAWVTSKAGLIAWEQAWAGEGVNAAAISEPRVFKPRLLADTNVVFVSIQGDGGIVGGGILNRGADVVGLSNLLVPLSIWSGGILRRWRARFFLGCRWSATSAAMIWRPHIKLGSRPLVL
jgi:hypothetical protein